MSDVQTPSTTEETTTQAPATTPTTKTERGLAKAMSFIASRAETAPAAPAAVTEPEAAETPAEAPATAETAPDADAGQDLAKAKAQQAVLKQQREAFEAKKRAKAEAEEKAKLAEQLKSYQDALGGKSVEDLKDAIAAMNAKDAKSLRAFMKKSGISLEDVANATLEEPDPEPEDPAKAELRLLKQQVEEMARAKKEAEEKLEREAQEREQARIFTENVTYVTDLLKQEADKYPALAGFPRAAAEIVRRANAQFEQTNEAPDLDQIMSDFHESVTSDVSTILAADVALKAFLNRPEVKERALSILGVKQSATSPASNQGENSKSKGAPTAIPPTAAADSGARKTKPQTQQEKVAAAMAFIKSRPSAR